MNTLQLFRTAAPETHAENEHNLTEYQAFREYMDRNKAARKARKLTEISIRSKPKYKNCEPRRRAQSTPQIRWLKNLICPFVYAEKTPDGIRPSVTKDAFIGRWNLKMGLPSLPNYKLLDHFDGRETIYFMGQGWEKADHTLGMIDIDVMKSKGIGSPAGARSFANHLNEIWPDLYFETSTNGNGIHGYFVLRKRGADAKRTNEALKRFELWLINEAKKINADIEQVEIKGTCLDLTIQDRWAQSVRFGAPAKLPRDVNRFDEWTETTVLRVCDLESSIYDVNDDVHNTVSEAELFEDLNDEILQIPEPVQVAKIKKVIVAGSVSGKFVNEDELAAIPAFEGLYREWVPKGLMAGKFRVTAHDFAVAMVLLRHFKSDANCDGSLPCRRVANLWTGLFEAGDIQRGWNHHRWKVIRDFLSERGHINWIDHRFELPIIIKDENGKTDRRKSKRGIACKWGITDDYDLKLETISSMKTCKIGGASFVDTNFHKLIPKQGKGQNLRPISCCLRAMNFWERANQALDLLFAA